MSGPTAKEVGADLAELYHKGKVTLPNVADQLKSASAAFGGTDTSSPFTRTTDAGYQSPAFFPQGGGFPGGVRGPGPDFGSAIGAICGHINGLESTLRLCGTNIVKTAQDLAETDADVRSYYLKLGGKL